MIETCTYETVIPKKTRDKYDFYEVGYAAAVMDAVHHETFGDILNILDSFSLTARMLLTPGGNLGLVASSLDEAFDNYGWIEARVDTERTTYLIKRAGNTNRMGIEEEIVQIDYQYGYNIDNVKDGLAVDIEWNPKDGNLDRDLSAYRAWHEAGLIVGAALITRMHSQTRELTDRLWSEYVAKNPTAAKKEQPVRYTTTTTANFEKALDRIKRGDAGTCPILLVGIGEATWDGVPFDGQIVKRGKKGEPPHLEYV